MKKFSKLDKEKSKKFNVQDNTIGYLSVEQLKKYKEVVSKFLQKDTKLGGTQTEKVLAEVASSHKRFMSPSFAVGFNKVWSTIFNIFSFEITEKASFLNSVFIILHMEIIWNYTILL